MPREHSGSPAVHSERIAASGLSFIARFAGIRPAMVPISVEKTIAESASQGGINEIFMGSPIPALAAAPRVRFKMPDNK